MGKGPHSRRRTAHPTASGSPPPHSSSRAPAWLNNRVLALCLVLAGAVAYSNSLNGPFIFDDRATVVDNASIRSLSTAWRPDAQTPVAGRPIANLSFALNYAFGDTAVQGYHAANVAVHMLAGLVLFGWLRRMAATGAPPAPGRGEQAGSSSPDLLAWLAATAWLLHPLNTEAVDYVTQRTESLVGLFTFVTLYAAARAASEPRAWAWPALAIGANLLGVGTKESMVVTPVLVVLADRTILYASWREVFRHRALFYAGLAAAWLVFLALAASTPFFSEHGFATQVSRWTYLMNQAPIILRYLRLSVWPIGLVADYGVPLPLTLADVWPSAAVLVLLAILVVVALVRAPKVGFWGAWFFLTLAPASSVIAIPTEVGAERRMYLPLVAVVVLLVSGAARLASRDGFAWLKRAAWPLAAAILAAFGAATLVRNAEYRDGVTLWETVLARRPHTRAHANLAAELRLQGRIEDSIAHLRIAAPDDADAKHALGSALLERGQVAEAVLHLQEFVDRYPSDPHVISGREELASGLYNLGRAPDAIAVMRQVVAAAPDYSQGHLTLANMLLSAERFTEAAAEYRQVLRIQPQHGAARTRLGLSLLAAGDLTAATDALQRAVTADPRDADAVGGLVDALVKQGRLADAEQAARTAVAANAADARAHSTLGVALASGGRRAEALEAFAVAARLDPNLAEAREGLARLAASAPGRR